jgi:PEP-CTERM motif-containing protein
MGRLGITTTIAAVALFAGQASAQSVCVGTCGTLGPDGVVTAPPGGGNYQYVSTSGGVAGNNLGAEVGGSGVATNGSTLLSAVFSATANQELLFNFNYVTSDGAGYADYGWARLLGADGTTTEAWLVTARTKPDGSIIPGQEMPAISATLTPASVPIIDGGPAWSPLGSDSGDCFAAGCGYTGWVQSTYTIGTAGNYFLQFGVANWADLAYDSGLAFAGATIGGDIIDIGNGSSVPEPGSLILLGTGLLGLVGKTIRRRFTK